MKAFGPSLASSLAKTAAPTWRRRPSVVLVQALAVADRAQHGLDGERPVGRDQPGDLVGLLQRLAVGHDVADQAEVRASGALMWRPVSSRSAATV